jgi:hypothetical protein
MAEMKAMQMLMGYYDELTEGIEANDQEAPTNFQTETKPEIETEGIKQEHVNKELKTEDAKTENLNQLKTILAFFQVTQKFDDENKDYSSTGNL